MAVLNEFCAASLGSADRERLRAVMAPVLYHMPYATPQFELWDLDDDQWRNVMSGQCPTSALRTWRLAPMDCNSYLVITAIVSHEVGIARTAGRSLAGNYAAVFVDGTDHLIDGMAQPLVFPEMVTADPHFVDLAGGDFHLQPTSPLVNAGIHIKFLRTSATSMANGCRGACATTLAPMKWSIRVDHGCRW